MRLFGRVNGTIDSSDGAAWLTCPLGGTLGASTPPVVVMFRPSPYGPPILGAPWLARGPTPLEGSNLRTAPVPVAPVPIHAPEITVGPPLWGAPWRFALPTEGRAGQPGTSVGPLPGARRPSTKKPFVPRVPEQGRRGARASEQVAQILNSLLAGGYIRLVKADPPTYAVLGGALTGTRAPTSDDDAASGATAGCAWVDTAAGKIYLCVSATIANAIWKEVS